jgi:hypothetical protein
MTAQVIDIDRGMRRFVARLSATRGLNVTVGIHPEEGAQAAGTATLATVANVHEFGAPSQGIPQRSWLRATVDQERARIISAQRKWGQAVARRAISPIRGAALVGQTVETMVKKRILGGIDPPLEDATIDRKGSSKPLIDTGQFLQSITSKVRRGRQVIR